MKKLETILLTFSIICIVTGMAIGKPPHKDGKLSVRVRYDRYLARRAEVRMGLVDLWGGHHHFPSVPVTNFYESWTNDLTGEVESDVWKVESREMTAAEKGEVVDTGWVYHYKDTVTNTVPTNAPHNQVWMYYDVSDLQTGLRATQARIDSWKAVAGNPSTFKVVRDKEEQ